MSEHIKQPPFDTRNQPDAPLLYGKTVDESQVTIHRSPKAASLATIAVPPQASGRATTNELIIRSSHVLGLIDLYDGEITPEVQVAIDQWLAESDDKLGALRAVRLRANTEAAMLKEETDRLSRRRKAVEKLADHMDERAMELLKARVQLGEAPRVKTSTYTVWLQDSQRVVGPEKPEEWPFHLQRSVTTISPDKVKAKELIEAGTHFENVRLETVPHVHWR